MTETQTPKNAKAQAKADKAYAKANRPWYKKKRFWVLGLIVLIALVTMLTQGDDGTTADEAPAASSQQTEGSGDAPAAEEPAAEEPAAEEPALEVTAQQLIDDLEANALAAANTYKDKRVTVTGKVDNIDASGDYFTITGTEDFTLTSIRVDIDESFLETVSAFTTGQDVTVTGEVTGVGEFMGYEIEAETIG